MSTLYEKPETINGDKYIRLKGGRLMTFWDAIRETKSAHKTQGRALSRALKLAADDYDLERLEWLIDDLERQVSSARSALDDKRGVRKVEERIALLRNTDGRTPEEAEMFRRKADELEARQNGAQS